MQNHGLTSIQQSALQEVLHEQGFPGDRIENILACLGERLGAEAPAPRDVRVSQSAHTVEAGASMVGLKADRIG